MRTLYRSACVALCVACLSVVAAGPALAAGGWNESVDGDFSNDGLNPTTVTVSAGSNPVIGTTGSTPTGLDRDYFSFTVPTGFLLSSLHLLGGSTISGGSGFLAVQAGPQITASPNGAGAEALIGYVHYTEDMVGTDILTQLLPAGTFALGSGTYSVWIQELGSVVDYGLDIGITPVPEPAAWSLLLAGLAALGLRRSRR